MRGASGWRRGCDACARLDGWRVEVGVDEAKMHGVRRVAGARAGVVDLVLGFGGDSSIPISRMLWHPWLSWLSMISRSFKAMQDSDLTAP